MWIILEPVIFALIGTEIQINKIDPTTIGYGTVVLVGALLIRTFLWFVFDHYSLLDCYDAFLAFFFRKLFLFKAIVKCEFIIVYFYSLEAFHANKWTVFLKVSLLFCLNRVSK